MKYLITCFALITLFVGCASVNTTTLSTETDNANRAAINAFYNKALTVNSQTRPTAVLTPLMAEGYKSSSAKDAKDAEALMGQLEGFWKMVPDLKWEPQEIVGEGNVYTVRSIATGTPNGNFMGTPTDGSKSFKILTVDTHTMKNGKFVSTHHFEDWGTAMQQLKPNDMDKVKQGQETMKIAMAYMDAMGKGDMKAMDELMHEDMVWQNGGDKDLPWIGPWNGKKAIMEEFFPAFGANFKTTKWVTEDSMASGDTAVMFGQMIGLLNKSSKSTPEFTWALRVKVKDGKVILWNWLEDSFEVSKAYHGK